MAMETDVLRNEILHDEPKSKKKYKCCFEGCKLEFIKPSALDCHTNVHLNMRPYECTFEGCNKSYSSMSHLKRHAKKHDKTIVLRKYKCQECTGYFSNTSNLKRHIKRAHSDDAKICRQCNKKFRKVSLYEEHMELYHKYKLRSYECEDCGKLLSNLKSFKRHKKKHLTKNYQCPLRMCSMEFLSKALLIEHTKSCHVLQYSCADCDKIFYSKNNLKSHVLTHFDKRTTFPCTYEDCTRVYYFKKNLSQHIRSFHMGRTFQCSICNCELSTKQKLDQHLKRIHKTKEMPDMMDASQIPTEQSTVQKSRRVVQYRCADCNRVYYSKAQLKYHVLTHIKDRTTFPCPYKDCDRLYYFKKNLRHHINSIHKGKTLICKICNTHYPSKGQLNRHVKARHIEIENVYDTVDPNAPPSEFCTVIIKEEYND